MKELILAIVMSLCAIFWFSEFIRTRKESEE